MEGEGGLRREEDRNNEKRATMGEKVTLKIVHKKFTP